MKLKELLEIYKKDSLFMEFNSSAELDIDQFILLSQEYKLIEEKSHQNKNDEKTIESFHKVKEKIYKTALLYLIYQCKKTVENSLKKEISISNKSHKYNNAIVYIIENDKNKCIVKFPKDLTDLNLSIKKEIIKNTSFKKDMLKIMNNAGSYKSFVKESIGNFVEFYTYYEKKKIEKALFENLSSKDEYLTIKRL